MTRFGPPDTSDPSFEAFRECVGRGASWQDIYADSSDGYAIRKGHGNPQAEAAQTIAVRATAEFSRTESHYQNLVVPVDAHYGVEGKQVLDFGCGTGGLTVALALAGASRVTALDPTMASLEATRHRATYHGVADRVRTMLCAPRPGLPLRRGSFDLVITNSVLEFIPIGREAYVRELIDLLRPGGHLVVSTENGLFPTDYYTGMRLPRLRRARARRMNWPYGSTWSELHQWACAGGGVRDLSPDNPFNSLDNVSGALRAGDRGLTAGVVGRLNRAFRAGCRAIGIPSDVFLPYATFVFQRDDLIGAAEQIAATLINVA